MPRKPLTKLNVHLLLKNLHKAGIEATYLNLIKAIYEKHTENIIFNGEKLKVFPLMSGTSKALHSHQYYSTQFWMF